MFTIFQKNKSTNVGDDTASPNSQVPRRMTLDERKAFRHELLDQVIRESLQSLEVASTAYHFRIMPLDGRHHTFIAMVDVTHAFHPRWPGGHWNFVDLEAFIRKKAFESFRLMIRGIYWRVGGETGH